MPTPCYVRMTGITQGLVTQNSNSVESVGDSYVESHKDEMIVQSVEHSIIVPVDPQSSQPSGQRRHDSIVMYTPLNSSIPLLYNALVTGEKFSNVELNWYRTAIDGKQENFFRTTLTNATITAINAYMPHSQDARMSDFTQLMSIHINYRKIEWDHLISGTSGSDDWRKPNEAA